MPPPGPDPARLAWGLDRQHLRLPFFLIKIIIAMHKIGFIINFSTEGSLNLLSGLFIKD
jgi:hypothetical protein